MAVFEAERSAQMTRLSRATFVVVRAGGIFVPRLGDHPTFRLSFGQLVLLEQLGQGTPSIELVAGAGPDPTEVDDLLRALSERGLLLSEPASPDLVPRALAGRFAEDVPAGAAPVAGPPASSHSVDLADDDDLVANVPLVLHVTREGFVAAGHDGDRRGVFDALQLDALASFSEPRRWKQALRVHRQSSMATVREAPFRELAGDLLARGHLVRYDPDDPSLVSPQDRARQVQAASVRNQFAVAHHIDRQLEQFLAAEREQHPSGERVPITPIQFTGGNVPLGIAMVLAYAKEYDDGRLGEHYSFRPDWLARERPADEVVTQPGLFLFSNYIWSHAGNLVVSDALKSASPTSVTVHGGPDSPKYESDLETYFGANPHVDVVVHGEGEQTTAELLDALAGQSLDRPADLSVLGDVPGLSFRLNDRIVRTGDRERIADLDSIPSPYLTGFLQPFGDAHVRNGFVETNRGCPYGCTFCDWGSATLSRIRKFDLDRVFEEIEWFGANQVEVLYFCDANFGILERDVAIAERVADVKARYGFPKRCYTNYAKNTTKHLRKIIEMWNDAGMLTLGQLSLQSMDETTLTAVNRRNIKVEKYDDLAREFRRSSLPLYVDLMMGLPGATTESFHADLQDCIEREVIAKIFATTLLPNSPMNEPSYRAEHRIVAEMPETPMGDLTAKLVVEAASFTRSDMEEWTRLRRTYLWFENYGVLRHVARYVRHEVGLLELDLYRRLQEEAPLLRERYPHVAFVVEAGPGILSPPGSWMPFAEELGAYLVDSVGVADDPALDTALRVQHALLPSRDRAFPCEITLAHDYVSWYRAIVDAKEQGIDWTTAIPALRSYGPGVLHVEDPEAVCGTGLGDDLDGFLDHWELASAVSRPLRLRPNED